MNKTVLYRLLCSCIIVVASITVYLLKDKEIPFLDSRTDAYFETVSTRAVSAYGITRGVNAVVSVVKESQLSVSPAGVGLTIAGGQILDPLDDMTERLSSVLVTSIVSIGIQKISMEVGRAISVECIAYLLIFLFLPLWFSTRMTSVLMGLTVKLILVLCILRFFLPASMIANAFFYAEFLEENISTTKQQLRIIAESGEEISRFDSLDYGDSVLDSINSSVDTVTKKTEQMRRLFNKIKANLTEIIGSLLDLTTYYILLLIVQIILIPLLVFWLTIRIVNTLFVPDIHFLQGRYAQPAQTDS